MSKTHQSSISDQLKKGLHDNGITTRSIVAFVIFGMIVVVFVLSDLTGRQGGGSSMGAAAEVNGEIISIKDFQDEENRLSQYYSQLFGGQFDNDFQRNMLRNEVMNSLVNRAITAQAAQNSGIYATDAEVRHIIVNELPYFKKDGVFQSDTYRSILTANRLTPGDFESKIRKDIQNQRSRQIFESAFSMTKFQKDLETQLRSSQIKLEFVSLKSEDFIKLLRIPQSQISERLANPEFKKKVEDYYQANKTKFETPEQVKASHILISANVQNDSVAREKAEAALKRTLTEDFGKLAAELSDDPGSKVKKGDLGFFGKGQMVPEFEKAAFELPVGKISGLVKSNFGYHIIKVTDKKSASKLDLNIVQNEIAEKIISDEKYLSLLKQIEKALSEGQFDAVKSILTQEKLSWQNTGYFSLAAEVAPIMNSSQAVKLALTLTKADPIARKLVREGDTQFIVRLSDIKTDVENVKPEDQSMLEKQKATSAFSAWISNFKKSAKIQTNSALTSTQN
jgi:peptidyl-prolyl cis-trans isomerase D